MVRKMSGAAGVGLIETDYHRVSHHVPGRKCPDCTPFVGRRRHPAGRGSVAPHPDSFALCEGSRSGNRDLWAVGRSKHGAAVVVGVGLLGANTATRARRPVW